MNASILAGWFADHHPTITPNIERWTNSLIAHEPHELAHALNTWAQPEAPRPAEVSAAIREERTRRDEVVMRRAGSAKLAELRQAHPRRAADELAAKARMFDERRYVTPPVAPKRKAS